MGTPALSKTKPVVRFAIEVGPLLVFFVANAREGIFVATGVLMGAIVLSVAASYALERRLPVMPMVTAVVVLVFGGLTLYLQDELFIKLKPTIVNLLFASAIFVGLKFQRNFIRVVLGSVMQLTGEGWHRLAVRWGGFFVVLAILNEIAWRNFSTDTWVAFKVFGIIPLTIAFSIAQVPLLTRFAPEEDEG